MAWIVSLAGLLIVLVALWDVFHTLWHPAGQGRISKGLMNLVWRACRPLGLRARRLSGPAGMGIVIVSWAGLVTVGCALVYWSFLPQGFSYTPGIPESPAGIIDAFYLSLVTVATLGFGDIVPAHPWLRLTSPLQALMGFAILTAAVSWVLQVYPALTRRRVLSLKLSTLERTDTVEALNFMQPATAVQLLNELVDRISHVHVDLTQYAETYYFQDPDPDTSLPNTISYACELAIQGQTASTAEVRHTGAALRSVIDDLASLLDRQYLHTGEGTQAVLRAYRRDHQL